MQRLPVSEDRMSNLPRAHTLQMSPRTDSFPSASPQRSRSNTVQSGPVSKEQPSLAALLPLEDKPDMFKNDIFETQDGDDEIESQTSDTEEPLLNSFEVLPIEIQSLSERFLESLSAPIHPGPLGIDALSQLFQEFYERVETHIATHIATLSLRMSRATKHSRDQSPAPSIASTGSANSRTGSKFNARPAERPSSGDVSKGELQMITASEITDRRKARRQLELKRIALEEIVEKGVCEKVYLRLWQHKSTQDEERDLKLRSRAAALSVIGIGLRELLSTALGDTATANSPDLNQSFSDKDQMIRSQLSEARLSLLRMNDEKYPLGKLSHLIAAHKQIVDSLSKMFPSLSSADEILPTLIYTIIISDPETIQVISNLNFIQRFRANSKIDGEAAYCLTNLEASISFLETVDLSAIRKGEDPGGPPKAVSKPSTPRTETPDPMYQAFSSQTTRPRSTTKDSALGDVGRSTESSSSNSRRFSNLRQIRPKPLEYASETVLNGADIAYETIHSALDGSFKFLFGRLREKQNASGTDNNGDIIVPKTLDDARKLVNSPHLGDDGAGNFLTEENSLEDDSNAKKALEMIAGRRARRAQSIESTGSSNSREIINSLESKSALATAKSKTESGKVGLSMAVPSLLSPTPVGQAAVESMRYLGNTLNPLNRLSGMGVMSRFGKPTSVVSTPTAETPIASRKPPNEAVKSVTTFDLHGIAPPITKFVDLKDPKALTLYEVELLLMDYQRLAGALRAAQAAQVAPVQHE